MRLLRRSLRVRIVALVTVPVFALAGLYAFVLSLTFGSYASLNRAEAIHNTIAAPTQALQVQLDGERGLVMQLIARARSITKTAASAGHRKKGKHARLPGTASAASLAELATLFQQLHDRDHLLRIRISEFEKPAIQETVARGGPELKGAVRRLNTGLNSLLGSPLEAMLTAGQSGIPGPGSTAGAGLSAKDLVAAVSKVNPLVVLLAYSQLVTDTTYVLNQAIVQPAGGALAIQAHALIGMDQARQIALEESDLLNTARTIGNFTINERHLFAGLVNIRQAVLGVSEQQLDQVYVNYFNRHVPAAARIRVGRLEAAVDSVAPRHKLSSVPLTDWNPAVAAYTKGMKAAEQSSTATLNVATKAQARAIVLHLALSGGLGLLAILLAAGIALLIGRELVAQLSGLRQSALKLANTQLPEVIGRLRAGETVTADEQPSLARAGLDEVEKVQQAFAIVQRTAIEAAVDEARVRRGVNDVFRNLARRSQALLGRQLALLDTLERRAQGPEELADLFRLDHLTTRMRRHAEGLLILAGGTSGRSWRDPVPVVDVLRAAVAEVEDYTRFRVLSTTGASVAGYAVADIVHLVAELAENATLFSPVNTPVRVEANAVAKGISVEIEDRGLGISDTELRQINERLADPPQFELSGSDQLGLFIAARLAKRHDVGVTLRTSAFGGTSAIVLLPRSVIVEADQNGELTDGISARYSDGRRMPALLATPAAESPQGVADPLALAGATAFAGHAGAPAIDPLTGVEGPAWSAPEPHPGDGARADMAAAADPSTDSAARFGTSAWSAARVPPADLATGIPDTADPIWPVPDAAATADLPATPSGSYSATAWPAAADDRATTPQPSSWAGAGSLWTGRTDTAADTGPAAGGAPPWADAAPPWADAAPPAADAGTGPPAAPWADAAAPATPRGTPPWEETDPDRDRRATDAAAAAWQPAADPDHDRRAPDPAARQPAADPPAVAPFPAAQDTALVTGSELDEASLDLPVRVKQASLAPQLRNSPRRGREPVTNTAKAVTPETARSTMSAWQRGWERGRSASAGADDQSAETAQQPPESQP